MALTERQIGRYRIEGELGRGATGVVYRGFDPVIGRAIALKTIHLGSDGASQRERLLREARSAGQLSHPNIVAIYDILEEGDTAWVVLELVVGRSLEALLGASQALSRDQFLSIMRQVAGALDYAHSKGIVHRDVKPANILLETGGAAKLTDFGVAKILALQQTQTGAMMGTPNYMAPEQVTARGVDGRTDEFSLAVIAFELLTGEKPFPGENVAAVVYQVVHALPAPAVRLNPSLSLEVSNVIARGLSKAPAERFASCGEFVRDLETALSGCPRWNLPPRGKGDELPTASDPPAPRRNFRPYAYAAATCLAIILLVWFLTNGTDRPVASATPEILPSERTPLDAGKPGPTDEPPPQVAAPEEKPVAQLPAAPPPVTSPAVAHKLSIQSEPSGIDVQIDDGTGPPCKTPCEVTLDAGWHRLATATDTYRPDVRGVEVPRESSVRLVLQRRTGTLMVRSSPPGATIMVNGKEWPSKTPAMLTLAAGKYKLGFTLEGHRPESHEVEIRDGAVANLDINWSGPENK